MIGTLVNTACIVAGTLVGTLFKKGLGEKYTTVLFNAMGLASIAMRLEIKAGINNCTIINDYYNSDVNSLTIALDVMNQQQQHKEKVLF